MNRVWATFFGRGIVNTVQDFGLMGEPPSHPELLDWLATEFVRTWDVKAMHRLMVMSSTYRQANGVTPELLKRDPGNVLLARGPRNRVEAEMVRDVALALAALVPNAPAPVFGEVAERPNERNRAADLVKTATQLAWAPRVTLHEGLKRTLEYYARMHRG
jgi:hypothetical protein